MGSEFQVKGNIIQDLSLQYLQKLNELWTTMFNDEMCNENWNILVEHVNTFYEDLYQESVDKRDSIKNDIEKLQEEAQNLNRLLKLDRRLPTPEDNAPLWDIQTELDKSLNDMRECLGKRKDQIYELLLEQEALCDELGEAPRPLLDDPLPSEDEIQDFRMHLDHMKGEKVNRQYEISSLRREIKNFLQALEISATAEDEDRLLNDRHIPLTRLTVNSLKDLQEQYCRQMEEVRESIDNMKNKLKNLWERLDVCSSIREKFLKYTDYSQTTYDKLYGELDRCETLKRQNVKRFVDQIRDEIVIWWDKTLKSDIERSRFSNFTNDCYTDDLLSLHEMELDDLKRFFYSNEKIFELITERKTLWDRMVALEAKASEPGRYNNRGGQLLKEEKERKTIASKLPKIEGQLTELVNSFEEDNSRKFFVFGENILDILSRDWEKKRVDKEKLMSARKQGQTPLSKTILGRTPMSARNASIRKAPSSTNISSVPSIHHGNKRKLNEESINPTAKRSLMNAFSSPRLFLKPSNAQRTPFKSPLKKTRIIATTINKRRSVSRSGNIMKKRRSTAKMAPKIVVSEFDSDVNEEGESYDSFQKYIEMVPTARSSIIQSGPNAPRHLRNKKSQIENTNLPNPRLFRTPSKVNVMEPSMSKSPGLSRTDRNSPMPSSSRKLTTKNLPIII